MKWTDFLGTEHDDATCDCVVCEFRRDNPGKRRYEKIFTTSGRQVLDPDGRPIAWDNLGNNYFVWRFEIGGELQ